MGGEQKVTMFTMNKFVSSHLIEKLPVPQAEESSETPVKLEDEIEEDDIASEVFDEEETESEAESD